MNPLSVLYVDDDEDIRTIVGMSLSLDSAITLTVATSGEEALNHVAAGLRPDVALLDVMMPGLNGLALMERLHALAPTAQLPVIFITARSRAADVAFYREQGALGVITKPFDPLTLASAIRETVGKAAAA